MARSSSPVFNEAPSVPADASEPVMMTKTSTSSGAASSTADASVSSASATSSASASTSVVTSTTAPVATSDCLKASSGAASPSGVDAAADAASPVPSQRFARVPPVVLQSVKASLSFRKSCLKRSKSSAPPPAAFETHPAAALRVEENTEKKDTKAAQKNRRRCWQCKVKVGLTAVKCRCDYTFCGKHRYAEEHSCAFNFKTAAKRKLEEENPVVVPSKVARIN
ncbi:hypothetical protein PF005_g14718 [Phytophthora fragariae]|uniref:AN1-type domain-containing protein n=1 Tax=Phytophthora fragariae TaxID=53985 RepID=A0A6A3ERH0_9STRA|nr:hypothetical protein PF003_g25236 [Phytophthora fragariae]KAE8934010.1 hypothetical protein PF009_g15999 [Phytophthora fragariae]KAE9001501.1 hypothetical protein PF011_g13715 [Phytophthora fragariae]KAE9101497.1 hypothetical protein PF007_g15129 [Phytophthora fragariae]KAE9101694.1 hypothetical protein PF010_g14371 [Phytophthora fragariae]